MEVANDPASLRPCDHDTKGHTLLCLSHTDDTDSHRFFNQELRELENYYRRRRRMAQKKKTKEGLLIKN